jgi:hypothetical protein
LVDKDFRFFLFVFEDFDLSIENKHGFLDFDGFLMFGAFRWGLLGFGVLGFLAFFWNLISHNI